MGESLYRFKNKQKIFEYFGIFFFSFAKKSFANLIFIVSFFNTLS